MKNEQLQIRGNLTDIAKFAIMGVIMRKLVF